MDTFGPLVLTLLILVFSVVLTVGVTAISLAVPGFILYRLWAANAETQRLLTSGVQASAMVAAIQQTGTLINFNPECLVTLEVQPPDGGATFQANARLVVPMVALPRVQPGAVVEVRYDPSDRSKITIAGF